MTARRPSAAPLIPGRPITPRAGAAALAIPGPTPPVAHNTPRVTFAEPSTVTGNGLGFANNSNTISGARHMLDTLDQLAATTAALTLHLQLGAWRAAASAHPYMWVAIPAVYAQCARQIRITLARDAA